MQLWGGRFAETGDERVADFTRSIGVDQALALDDIQGSIAHVRGLGRAWLLTIVRNVCFTQFRRRRSGGERVEFDEAIHSLEPETSEPEADLASTIAAESVRAGLDQLAVEFREVLVLRELEGLSYKEIAQVAGVPIGTVMSRLARARKQLLLALGAGAKEND